MFDPFFDAVGSVLAWFYGLTSSYALAIVLLTLVIMLLFTPLTLKGTRSMMAMQELQPEIKRLQKKHGNDRQALNEEMMALYRERKVNPLGGCLPTLVQLPFFLVLYRVINGISNRGDDGNFLPKNLDESSEMYQDLVLVDEMNSIGLDLSRSANDVLRSSFVDALPYLVLVAVTFGLAWFQQKQMRARRPEGATAPNPQTEMIMKILPFMLPVFTFFVQAALGVYFVTSSLYRIGQQAFIHRTMPPPPVPGQSLVDDDDIQDVESRPSRTSSGTKRRPAGTPTDADVTEPNEKADRSNSQATADERAAARRARSEQRRKGTSNGRGGRGNGQSDDAGGKKPRDSGQPKPIQSRRTTGDTRPNRRKKR